MIPDEAKKRIDPFHWAKKVPRKDIKRLYESDAQGLLDDELLARVSSTIYTRVCDMFEVMQAQQTGRVNCRACGEMLPQFFQMGSDNKGCLLTCDKCGWQVTCGEFYDSYTGERMLPGSVPEIFQEYLERWSRVRTPQEKMLLIDWLIHQFHENIGIPGRPVGENIIQGSKDQISELIASLAKGPDSTPGTCDPQTWLDKFNHPVRRFASQHTSAEIEAIARRLNISVNRSKNKNRIVLEIFKRDPSLVPDEEIP